MRIRQNRLEPKRTDELSARTEPQPGENANTDHKKEQAIRINLSTEALARGGQRTKEAGHVCSVGKIYL